MKQSITTSIISFITTLLWVGIVGVALFLAWPIAQNYNTIQAQLLRRDAILGCAQASKTTYTEKTPTWERSTEQPNQEFYNSCLKKTLGE